jgi:N-acetyl-alpha-D-muramate 1-phosphate uridylyltransferase
MKAMILAAGRGQRLRPLTDHTPKPLLEVYGKPLIVHHLERLAVSGFADIVINTAWLGGQIENYLGGGSRYGVSIRYSEEPAGALDTGGGIMHALPLLGAEPFLVVNGDIYTDFPFESLRTAFQQGDLAHLVMVANPLHHPQGDFHLSADGRLHADGKSRLTYAGIGIHSPEFFKDCVPGKFPMLPWWQRAMREDKVSGQFYSGLWRDVGSIETLRDLEQHVAS